jgi:NitT/TauT family transport system substrate-binding protein
MRVSILARVLLAAAFALSAGLSQAQTLRPLRVAHDYWVGYAGFFVAMERGYFKEAGLRIDEKVFSTPADGLPPLLAGDVDVHLSTLDTCLTANDRGADNLRVIALIDSSIGKSTLEGVPGLRGKKVGVSLGQANHLLLLKALAKYKVPASAVSLVNLNGDDAGNAFAAGKVDAAVTWEPFITQGLTKGGQVLYSTRDAPDFIINAVAVRPATVQAKKEELVAFLGALAKGTAWAIDNPSETARIVGKALEQDPQAVRDMMNKDRLYTLADSTALIGTGAKPGKAVQTTREIAKFLFENKMTAELVDAAKMFDGGLLPLVK